MPAVTNLIHEPFPQDDRLYRIYWGGQLLLPKPGQATRQIRFWLKEIDEHGLDLAGGKIVQVTESVGSIPRLTIGSVWRNRSAARPKQGVLRPKHTLEISAPSSWTVVRAGDYIPEDSSNTRSSHTWINRSDLPLIFDTAAGRKVRGLDAQVVSARTTSGQEIIVPSYEIFRAFFAGTSDLAHALLSKTWDAAEKDFIVGSNRDEQGGGIVWHIDLAPRIPPSAVPYIGWLHFDEPARQAANHICSELVNQSGTGWISAMPPIVDKTFRINAHVMPLHSRNALLVTQILSVEFPIAVSSLSYSIPTKPTLSEAPIEGGNEIPISGASKGAPTTLSTPIDRKATKHYFSLPSSPVKFFGLPPAKKMDREERIPHTQTSKHTSARPTPLVVSVGATGTGQTRPTAQLTPEEAKQIEDRFQAILDLVAELQADGLVSDAIEYPIVRPAPFDIPTYCRFPHSSDIRPWPWTMVRTPVPRERLALVLQISIEERLIYWIETEATTKNEHYCALAVEMTDGSSLDEGTLEALLDVCAKGKGVWPKKMPFGQGTVLTEKARHTTKGAALTRNVMLNKFSELAQMHDALSQKLVGASGSCHLE